MQVTSDVTIEELQNLYKVGARAFAVRGGEATNIYHEVQKAKWQVTKEKKDVFLASPSAVCGGNCDDCGDE